MRGEYARVQVVVQTGVELPPHARRIHLRKLIHYIHCGTTSACAENTVFSVRNASTTGNYLRMRGEYAVFLDCLGEFE